MRERLIPLLAITLAFSISCRREISRPAVERIAVLRFENLGPDPAGDWMGRAFSEIITSELNDIPGIYAIPAARIHALENGFGPRPVDAPGISAERTAALAAGATTVVFGQYAMRNGRLEARLTVEDELTGKMKPFPSVEGTAADIVSAATQLARQLSPRAKTYATVNASVVETHVKAFERIGNPDVRDALIKAIAADPNFGPSYRQLAQIQIQQRDIAGAEETLRQALARGDGIPAAERALIRLEEANLHNDPAARIAALTALAGADPYNVEAWQNLGVAQNAAHQYAQAEQSYQKALALQPDDGNLWNQLGYAAAYAGDKAGADKAIQRYRALAPGSPNPLDSLGDINLIEGNLAQAQAFYSQSAKQFPQFFGGLDFLKAAMARLMTGDVSGADALAQQYFDARAAAKDPLLDYRKAQWAWISGRRQAASAQMEQIARASETAAPPIAAHAYAEAAMWTLISGDRPLASEMARKAVDLSRSAPFVQAALAQFLTQPVATAAEWQARARPLGPLGNLALSYALLLSKDFSNALPVLKSLYDNGSPAADEGLPVLLAWAYVETGNIPGAAPLLRFNPPLPDTGISWSTSLYFPRIFHLRAAVGSDAQENARIFQALSGDEKK